MMNSIPRVADFPDFDPTYLPTQGPWERWNGHWLYALQEPLALVTPWVRLVDYSLPGTVETEVPERWGSQIALWEQKLLRAVAATPSPMPEGAEGAWPRSPSEWKRRMRSWCHPAAHADRWNGNWIVSNERPLAVYVGAQRTPTPAAEALVPGQWVKLKVRCMGLLWDGHILQLAVIVDQVLVRQPWQEEVRDMSTRAMETMRAALLIGPQEEKILSLLDILSA